MSGVYITHRDRERVYITDRERLAGCEDDLIPHAVDRLAREVPDDVYAEWVTEDRVIAMTYSQLANLVNGLAWWLVDKLGGPGSYGPDAEVLAYVGPNDARYGALVLAAIKAGYVLFVTSPRNSGDAHRELFAHLHCRTLLTSDPVPPPGRLVLDAVNPPRHLAVPSVEQFLSKKHSPYQLDKTLADLLKTPFVIMHTSGTTGLPKPIIWTHETCAQVLKSKSRPPGNTVERELLNGKRVIVTLPPFHGALLAQLMVGAVPYGNVVIAPVATAIPTAKAVVDALKKTPAEVAILVPSVVAELAQDPELLDYCAVHLKTIMYIGGDLPQSVGDKVASKVYLRCLWGATETGIVPQGLHRNYSPYDARSGTLWRYIQFHRCVGAAFEEVADGVHELVIRRDKALEGTQPCFTVPGIDQLEEYRTKDLFEKHEGLPMWCWRARADDIIVFLNGEKTNPISMEQHIMAANPEVGGALVIGAQRFQAALLIESTSKTPLTTAEQAALIERIWPSVEEANRSAPAHARVEKSFILVLPVNRPLIRAGKGTFMRGPSISQYQDEIERLYANSEVIPDADEDDSAPETAIYTLTLEESTRLVRHHVRAVTDWDKLKDDANFFERGMDSLQGLRLVRAVRRAFHRHDFALSSIYQNPTVSQLARVLVHRGDSDAQDEWNDVENLIGTYRGLIQRIEVPKARAADRTTSKTVNVLLTGSTGTVGTHLLHALLSDEGIGHVFCLNRGDDGGEASQHAGFARNRFEAGVLDNRVTFIQADLQQPLLGLDKSTYESLRAKVGLMVHAAWPVNFNLALSAFRPQFAAVVNLLTLAAEASSKFVLVSSVAAVGRDAYAKEEVAEDWVLSSPFGYGRAKYIAEVLVDAAAQHFQGLVPTTVLRIGQVAGPVKKADAGSWSAKEWFPSMVLSSLHLGKVPDELGPFDQIDFVPVDMLAAVMVQLAKAPPPSSSPDKAIVFNVRNPHPTAWKDLLPTVVKAREPPLQVVSPKAWLAALRESVDADGDDDHDDDDATAGVYQRNPAIKLLGFFDRLWSQAASHNMEIGRALAESAYLRELEPVGLAWMSKWVGQWAETLSPS
ncbi:putative NRPS-like enzyme [Xylariaceae sp. FL0594]|nr:putative NRPS-like enzyme [Xylariaceae sp. FL0594]